MIEFAEILRGAGLPVVQTPGWRGRTHAGELTPIGGIWHHTGALKDLDVVINGREDLAGPLANLYHAKDGTWFVVSGGVAWHAGDGAQRVLDDVRNGVAPSGDALARGFVDDRKGVNHLFVGIESEGGADNHDDFTPAQIASLLAGTAALCRALGLGHNQWIHHREWTRRKSDMAYRGDLRGRLATLLGAAPHVAGAPAGPAHATAADTTTTATDTTDTADPPPVAPPPPKPEDVMYVVIEAPDRSPAFFTTDGLGHAMGRGGWTFINRFATKHPGLVVFDSSWTAEEYDMVVRLPVQSVDQVLPPGALPPVPDPGPAPDPEPGSNGGGGGDAGGVDAGGGGADGGAGPVDVALPPDLLTLPDDVPEPAVGSFG